MRTTSRSLTEAGVSLTSLIWTVLAGLASLPAAAGPGETILNGTNSAPAGIVLPGFLFEPEVPLNSLKTVPIWNELEQLLDNLYNVALCSSLPTSVDAL